MDNQCFLQLYLNYSWQDVASFSLFDPPSRGWQAKNYIAYTTSHAINHLEKRDAHAIAWNLPVTLDATQSEQWPGFVMDLLPQGYGRQELLRQLALSPNAGQGADWSLLLAGASNPIGNCRIREAHEWLQSKRTSEPQGFTQEAIATRGESFTEHLAQHGLFIAGSSGVQGEWPKLLLTQDASGLFYLDHQLPDEQAVAHWLVKFSRGDHPVLNNILKLESVWMELAQILGLHVHESLMLDQRALFIKRFDRECIASEKSIVARYAQESLYSLCERSGFGARLSHNEVCEKLAVACTEPLETIIEYLKRDIANVALGNTDNHGRNTAITRKEDGWVGLTPLFDFAPMVLHSDGIARTTRWDADDLGLPNWQSVVAQVTEVTGLSAVPIVQALQSMAEPMSQLPSEMKRLSVDDEIITRFRQRCESIANQLEALTHG
ncbi:type II toxin-antitoxin system HipA family toxin [Leucothrix arctica]|uniref:Phosphatidylinositol kinase n=1 Tax=Leucothrix arctica TaxID=1481894 RepID=A0A317C7Q2_9GAMM|nr:HipA domain-containing protein [Leucothrix arctica]PWQ94498.1 phosphatidylinositol kinase [Leucothrix arctica]